MLLPPLPESATKEVAIIILKEYALKNMFELVIARSKAT